VTGVSDAPGDAATSSRAQRVRRAIVRIPIDYWVSICVFVAPAIANAIARAVLGDHPSPAEITELGYGWPALEAGRLWTPLTGAIIDRGLEVSFIPGYTFFAVVLLEHVAKHGRTVLFLVGGQVGGVLLGLLLTWPLKGGTTPFAIEQTTTIDFGISVGGFACLGAWTAYLGAPWRRPIRAAVSCYLLCQLLVAGLIFDVSHPMGWILGLVGGQALMRPQQLDRSPLRVPVDAVWLAVAVVVGTAVGIVAGWNGGGVGGLLGWGPGR
jgi:hypothetical protein